VPTDHIFAPLVADGAEILSVERIEPWFVDRVRFSDGRSVIVKPLREDASDFRTDPAQVLTEQCALRFLDEIGFDAAPRVLATGADVVVLKDLGPRPSLFDLLCVRHDDAGAAELAFARVLAELHAATVGLHDAYYDERRALAPVDPDLERLRYAGFGWDETQAYAEGIGARLPSGGESEMSSIMHSLADPGPFLAFSKVTPSPSTFSSRASKAR
jgi:hypothetical protein